MISEPKTVGENLSTSSSDSNSQGQTSTQPVISKKLLIIYFNGVSCMGKSELLKRFETRFLEKGIVSKKVSLDKVAKGIMDKYKAETGYNGEEAFTLNIGPIFDAYHSRILEVMASLNGANGVLMADDCSLDQKFMRVLLRAAEQEGYETQFCRMFPHPNEGFFASKDMRIHLSFQFVLNLCYRVLNRGFHHTFNYTPEKKLQLVLSFVRVYEHKLDAHLRDDDMMAGNKHKQVEIEFHHERELTNLCPKMKEIKKALKACLVNIVPFESPVTTAWSDLEKLVKEINTASPEEIKQYLSYGRDEKWQEKFGELMEFFES